MTQAETLSAIARRLARWQPQQHSDYEDYLYLAAHDDAVTAGKWGPRITIDGGMVILQHHAEETNIPLADPQCLARLERLLRQWDQNEAFIAVIGQWLEKRHFRRSRKGGFAMACFLVPSRRRPGDIVVKRVRVEIESEKCCLIVESQVEPPNWHWRCIGVYAVAAPDFFQRLGADIDELTQLLANDYLSCRLAVEIAHRSS